MKKRILITTASILGLVVSGFAAEGDKPGKPKGDRPAMDPEKRAAMMIERGDKNGDGMLDHAELVALFKAGPPKGGKPKGDKPKGGPKGKKPAAE